MRAAFVLLIAPCALSAYGISGTVWERSEDNLEPLRKALVVARTPDGKDVLAATRSDDEGRYALAGPFKGLVRISAGRNGFFVHSAGGTTDPYLAVNCDAANCGEFDFELSRAGVITGKVIDDLGEVVVGGSVRATAPAEEGSSGRQRAKQSRTDDRGEFRIFGLSPGIYQVRATAPVRGLDETTYASRSVELEVGPGEELALALSVEPSAHQGYRVTGTVTGIDFEKGARTVVQIRALKRDPDFPPNRGSLSASLTPEGAFEFSDVMPGIHEFRYWGGRGGRGRIQRGRPVLLDILAVRSDIEGLTLRPMPPTGLRGNLRVEDGSPAEPPALMLRSADYGGSTIIAAGPPEYHFSNTSMTPGKYLVALRRPDNLYLKRIEIGDDEVAGRELDIRRGRVREVTFVLSGALATISGLVKPASEDDPGPFRVGLKGESGALSVQTDQAGRFEFPRVVPGEYRIGAWARAGEKDLRSEALWRAADAKAPQFVVDEGSEIDISLTAVR